MPASINAADEASRGVVGGDEAAMAEKGGAELGGVSDADEELLLGNADGRTKGRILDEL